MASRSEPEKERRGRGRGRGRRQITEEESRRQPGRRGESVTRGRGRFVSLERLPAMRLPGMVPKTEEQEWRDVWSVDEQGEMVKDREIIRKEVLEKDQQRMSAEMRSIRKDIRTVRIRRQEPESKTKRSEEEQRLNEERRKIAEVEGRCQGILGQIQKEQEDCQAMMTATWKKIKEEKLQEIREELRRRESVWLDDMKRRLKRQTDQRDEKLGESENQMKGFSKPAKDPSAWTGEGTTYVTMPDPRNAYVVMEGQRVEEAGLFVPFARLEL